MQNLAALKKILDDVAVASQRMPAIAKNVEGSTANLPALLTQLQVTIQKLDQLVAQLQRSWLLGGGGGAAAGSPSNSRPRRCCLEAGRVRIAAPARRVRRQRDATGRTAGGPGAGAP